MSQEKQIPMSFETEFRAIRKIKNLEKEPANGWRSGGRNEKEKAKNKED